jgi:hypothetical protein
MNSEAIGNLVVAAILLALVLTSVWLIRCRHAKALQIVSTLLL